MDPVQNNSITDDTNSGEQQNHTESILRPTLSQVKKSWGFRQTTIARREFMEEVGDLTHSPPPTRRSRGRRANPTPQTIDTCTTQSATQATRSVIDDLEWSAPSSPVSEESKSTSETCAGGSLDPSLWQDFGSAFHTAFSLLGGNEGLSLDMPDALAGPEILEAADVVETLSSQSIDEVAPDIMESADDMDISLQVAHENVAGGDMDHVVLISSQEEDSDEMTLIQIKEQLASKSRQENTRTRGGKSGRGKARGRGRGRGRSRGKGRGRGRGRGRAVELQSSIGVSEESDDDLMVVNPPYQLQQEEKESDPLSTATETSPAHSDISSSPAQQSSSDCIVIDTDLDQITETIGQYDDALEKEEVVNKDGKNVGGYLSISDTEGYDSDTLYCICRQKHNKRFMICCDSCQEWFHGDCVGISETQGRKMEKEGQEYMCTCCTTKKQLQSKPQTEREVSFAECLTLISSGEEAEEREGQRSIKKTVEIEEEPEKAPVKRAEPEPEAEMETDSSLPLCIGPGCSKQALPDSGYCGTDCILQHAAVTMKTLSGPKVPKTRGRAPRKSATTRSITRAQRSGRMSIRLAEKAEEEGEEEEMKEDDGEHIEATSSLACDPSVTEVQAPSIPSSKFCTASIKDIEEVEAGSETEIPLTQCPVDTATDSFAFSHLVTEPAPPKCDPQEKANEPVNSGVIEQQLADPDPSVPQIPTKSTLSTAAQSSTTSAPRHHETGALMVTKTTYVIPKKQADPQPLPSSHISASASCQKPLSAPTLLNETRNLLVPPAPSAPSSRPSQPNNQIRQSIQRSLTSILLKRVREFEELEMSESEVAKFVASIETEMFDIFRNTDSKYMNKYRTIMFNLKDPRNKGLLYRVVSGEISPFRLVRMSQKDMQATKAPEPRAKEAEVKDVAVKATGLLQKPEAVKVDLPSLNPAKPDRRPDKRPDITEHKRSLPASALKTRTKENQGSAASDILTCMLKDTTSEHKAHLFDLKCKICTGQLLAVDVDEPAKKKAKVSESREKHESTWKQSAEDDSLVPAPPDSPDLDSTSPMDPTSRLIVDSPALTIVESPASPTMESPASPVLESPASPVMEYPASPTQDISKATKPKMAYAPIVIPAVSTVTITRRDPRTAASRFSALSGSASGPSSTTQNQSAPHPLVKMNAPVSSPTPTKILPKSILMKPSSSTDPRLYGTSRTMVSESSADGETAQFLAKQEIMWKGFLNMLTVAKFVTKGYLVSGCAENLKADLPDTIQIGGRIMPQTVWDYVEKLKTSVTKELCVIRFHPATEEEEVAYVSLFSYFSSRGRFGVVANNSRSIKDVYLVPLSAKESVPAILQPLEGPGLEKNRPNLLLGLAIVQKAKRHGSLSQELEEKRPIVHMPKDPMWIPKPPVLYGSDKLEIFQPYDPETPANTSPPVSPFCPESPSDSSSGSVPSLLTSIRGVPPVSTSAVVAATQSDSNNISDKNPKTASSRKTPLQTILKSLFGHKQTDSRVSSDGCSTTAAKTALGDTKTAVFSQVSTSMVDPIVQQYGQKSKVKEIVQEENDFDRPYDPEEEYDPSMGFGMVASQNLEKHKAKEAALSGFVDDDVAYDPEDDTIFEDIQSATVVPKPHVPTQTSDSAPCSTLVSTQVVAPASTSTQPQTSTPVTVIANLPTGTIVVSAATLTEQQRMLEELNKQIEEQKRQLKEQEEALRQQREAVGMFMAHFSVSDSLMSPPSKSLPLSQLATQVTDKTNKPTETMSESTIDPQTSKQGNMITNSHLKNDTTTEQDNTLENVKESDKYSSAGEIEDSDVAYDPEDESLFNEIQEDVFQGSSIKSHDSSLSRVGISVIRNGISPNSYHSRKQRLSPKRRSHRERDRRRSPSRKSQRRSPSRSRRRKERDRHKRSERDRSRHRTRDQPEHQAHHRKEHTIQRRSRGHRRSSLSPRKKCSVSLSPKQHRETSPQTLEKSQHTSVAFDGEASVSGQFLVSDPSSSSTPVTIKNESDGHLLTCNIVELPYKAISSSPHELLHKVKPEITDPSKFHDVQRDTIIDQWDKGNGSSTQDDKTSLFKDKIESTVPLREIDPPIRDSPESPDPEPQFVKPTSIEKSDFINTEENADPETHSSVSVPLVKVENIVLSVSGQATVSNICQATVSNILWPTVKNSMSNLKMSVPGVRDQDMIEADRQSKAESSDLKHPEMIDPQGRHSESSKDFDIQGSQHERDPMTKFPGPEMSGKCINNSAPNINESEQRGLLTGIDVKGSGILGESTYIWSPGLHIKDPGRSPMHKVEPSNMKCMNPEQHCLGIRNSEQEIRGQSILPSVKHSHLDKPDNRQEGVIEVGGVQSFQGLLIEDRAPDYIVRGRGRNNRGKYPHGGVMRFMRGKGVRSPSPGTSFGGSRCTDRPVIERGFQPHERNADFSGMAGVQEKSLDSNAYSDSGGSVLRTHRLTPAMTNDRQGPQRGRGVPMSRPRPNINFERGESNMPCNRQERSELRTHFKEPQAEIAGSPGTDFSEASPNLKNVNIQRRNTQDPVLEWSPGQMGQADRGPKANIKNLDWREPERGGVGPDMRVQRSQNKDQDPHMRNLDWVGQSSGITDNWRSSDRRGLDSVRGRSFLQNEWGVHQPNKREQNMENLGSDGGLENPGFMAAGPCVSFHDSGGQEGPDFTRSIPERKGPTMNIIGPGMIGRGAKNTNLAIKGPDTDKRELGNANFLRPGPERTVPGIRGPPEPDFRGPWPEKTHLDKVNPGPDKRGTEGQDVWGTVQEDRGPYVEVSGNDKREPLGPDFRGQRPECSGPGPNRGRPRGLCGPGPPGPQRRSLSIECTGNDNTGHEDLNLWGQGPENRGPPMKGPETDIRGPGSLGFCGTGPDRRRPGDFTGPGPDRRGPAMGSLAPDLRGPGHKRKGSPVDIQEPNKRGPGPDFQGSGHENKGLGIDRPLLERREPEISDLRGPRYERRGSSVEGQGASRRGPGDHNDGGLDFDKRGPYIVGPGPDHMGLGAERTCLGIEGPVPHSSRRGRPHFRGPGPESRYPNMEGPGPGRSSHIRGPWLEGPGMEGLEPNTRGRENNQRFPGGSSGMQGPGNHRRDPHFRQMQSEQNVFESQDKGPRDPDFRGPICESRGPNIVGPGPNRHEPEGYGLSETGPERRGPYMDGPGPGWRRSDCPEFRGPGIGQKGQNIEGPGHDSRDKWGGSDFRAPDPVQGGPCLEGPGPERTGQPLRGPRPVRRNIRRPGTNISSLNCEEQWNCIDAENQWADRRGSNMEDFLNETEGSGDCWKRYDSEGPDGQGQDQSRQDLHDEWRGPGPIQQRSNMQIDGPVRGPVDDWCVLSYGDPGSVQDNADIVSPGPSRRGPTNEWNEPDGGGCGPNRRGLRPFFRRERNPGNEGHGLDRKCRAIRGADMRNDWRQPDIRENNRESNIDGLDPHRGGPDLMNSCPNERRFEMTGLDKRCPGGPDLRYHGPRNRNVETEGPGTDRFSGSERRGVDMDGAVLGIHGSDFRRERRDPDMRQPGPDVQIGPGLDPRGSETLIKSDMHASHIIGQRYINREPDISDREPGQRGQTSNERRGPPLRFSAKSALPHLNNPHVTIYKGPSHPQSAPFKMPLASAPNSGGKCPDFDHPQNQKAVKPQRQRAALLPTPTEGLIRFPNCMTNNPDVFIKKHKQMDHSTDRQWSRGRPVSRERDLVKGQRQEQDKSSAGQML